VATSHTSLQKWDGISVKDRVLVTSERYVKSHWSNCPGEIESIDQITQNDGDIYIVYIVVFDDGKTGGFRVGDLTVVEPYVCRLPDRPTSSLRRFALP
jgi:hypothetical protein